MAWRPLQRRCARRRSCSVADAATERRLVPTYVGMGAEVDAARKRAGIVPCTIHDLRQTFCTDLARLGVNQLVVQRLAGHTAAATTARYYQWVGDGTKRDAIERLGA